MKQLVTSYMARAMDCLKDANALLINEGYNGACKRAYYAYFDVVRALLATLDIATRSHSGVQSLFSQYFVLTKVFAPQDAKALSKLFDLRQRSDYDMDVEATKEDAEYAVEVTSEFLLQVEAYLREHGFAE